MASPSSRPPASDRDGLPAVPSPERVPPSGVAVEEDFGPTLKEDLVAFGQWCGRNPVGIGLVVGIIATLVYFFWGLRPYIHGAQSIFGWAWLNWDPEGVHGHGRMVPWIALGLVWLQRHRLAETPIKGSLWGLLPLLVGIAAFVLAIRCVQPRFGLIGFPFLLFGSVLYTWGWQAARLIWFPCAFLFFMIPVAVLDQATFELQFTITEVVGFLSRVFGIGIGAMGTTLTATDGSFNFEIAEGCSGIRSLSAMTMLTAVYVYLTQDRLWKQLLIFAGSVGFAIIGNIGRIFTVVLVAKYYDPDFASGLYHDYSGYVFFPIAVMAMLAFSKLVNAPFFNRKPAATQTAPSVPAA